MGRLGADPDTRVQAEFFTVSTSPTRERRASLLAGFGLAIAVSLLFPSFGQAAGPIYGEGTASHWDGPGVARRDCVWPWAACVPIVITSLETGRSYTVTPTMYCDCYVGRIGPNGETERIVDLDPAAVAALGLDWNAGLYPVRVEPAVALPDTALR